MKGLTFSKIDKQINICILCENPQDDDVYQTLKFLLKKYIDNGFSIKVEINGLISKI